ncbi:hypothetical protein ACFWUW_17135 [Streptomyces sp. NPDC058655]|uniref:hypothetical protein n=1 Tax=unclassified Streptomyces TaxID=2593676 RepID=UPI00365EDC22
MSARSFYWCRACHQPLYAASSATAAGVRDWEVDHQQSGDCANGQLLPLSGAAAGPEDLPHAAHVLRLFGS